MASVKALYGDSIEPEEIELLDALLARVAAAEAVADAELVYYLDDTESVAAFQKAVDALEEYRRLKGSQG